MTSYDTVLTSVRDYAAATVPVGTLGFDFSTSLDLQILALGTTPAVTPQVQIDLIFSMVPISFLDLDEVSAPGTNPILYKYCLNKDYTKGYMIDRQSIQLIALTDQYPARDLLQTNAPVSKSVRVPSTHHNAMLYVPDGMNLQYANLYVDNMMRTHRQDVASGRRVYNARPSTFVAPTVIGQPLLLPSTPTTFSTILSNQVKTVYNMPGRVDTPVTMISSGPLVFNIKKDAKTSYAKLPAIDTTFTADYVGVDPKIPVTDPSTVPLPNFLRGSQNWSVISDFPGTLSHLIGNQSLLILNGLSVLDHLRAGDFKDLTTAQAASAIKMVSTMMRVAYYSRIHDHLDIILSIYADQSGRAHYHNEFTMSGVPFAEILKMKHFYPTSPVSIAMGYVTNTLTQHAIYAMIFSMMQEYFITTEVDEQDEAITIEALEGITLSPLDLCMLSIAIL